MNNPDNQINEESQIMNLIADNEISILTTEKLLTLAGQDYMCLKPTLKKLVRNGQLFRIEKGLYCVRNFRNPNIIANALLADSVVGYWTALNMHNLTEQIPNTIYSLSTTSKNNKKVFNVRYKFIKVNANKVCGITHMGYGNESFRITDIEKTLLDCFDLPKYSGGYEELIRAFYNANISSTKLLSYGKQMNNLSVLKRLAFLSEIFEMKRFVVFQKEVFKMVNKRYTLLDPMGENDGEFNSKWRIRVNIQKERLLGIINKLY